MKSILKIEKAKKASEYWYIVNIWKYIRINNQRTNWNVFEN